MGDVVRVQDLPDGLLTQALWNIDAAAPDRFGLGVNDSDEMRDVIAAVVHATGLHLIDQPTQDRIAADLAAYLPGEPYERREALETITWSLLSAIGVKAL